MSYKVITALSAAALTSALTASLLDGWLIVGGVTVSGSAYAQAMTRGDGVSGLVTAESTPYLATGSSILSIIYPPTSSLGINTNPNVISVRT